MITRLDFGGQKSKVRVIADGGKSTHGVKVRLLVLRFTLKYYYWPV